MKSFLGEGVACMDLGKNVVNLSICVELTGWVRGKCIDRCIVYR